MTDILGQWGVPPDPVAMVAAASATAIWLLRRPLTKWTRGCAATRTSWCVGGLALFAAVASVGYFHFYLRGGPRIIDATYYFLQAKSFASGHLTIPLLFPTSALRGRFLYYDVASGRLSVLFPPGYAAALAIGVALKAPWLAGPAIAAGLVVATSALARRAFKNSQVAMIAALLSATCVTLRYHTADTLSHGWAALLFAVATWGALGERRRDFVVCGLSSGWLFATRPVSALALFALVLLINRKKGLAVWLTWGLSVMPGVLAWFVYQRVTTGSWLHTTQSAYYAVSDGPLGCFRYGFGKGIGCQFEHGNYVAKRLPEGFGALSALTVSAVRLRWHALDVLNFEPLSLLVVIAAVSKVRHAAAKMLLCGPLLLLLAYSPFYFDGNFPGGGARLLADAIPLEHALIAGWLIHRGRLLPVLVLSLLGFSIHGAFEHQLLKEREGGHPMFETSILRQAGITRGLVLVDTDHGFALGHEPGARDARNGLIVARAHHDAHDWDLWKSLGSPQLYYYHYDAQKPHATPSVTSMQLIRPEIPRFEAEAQWPVLAAKDAWAVPGYPPCACVSLQRALMVHPSGPIPTVALSLPVAKAGRYRVRVGWVKLDDEATEVAVTCNKNHWNVRADGRRLQCGNLLSPEVVLDAGECPLKFQFGHNAIALDWIQLEPAK